MTGHYITWRLSARWNPQVEIECREPAAADCRTHCPNCEEWCHDDVDSTRCGNYGCGETLVTGAECNAVLFIDGDPIEFYGGPDNEPIRDGLVEVEWDGDGYTWHYPEPVEQPTLDAHADRDRALAENARLTRLLGSHADGHRCTCVLLHPGSVMEPPAWEQDPLCPTHPDMDVILAERDRLRAVVEAASEFYDAQQYYAHHGGEHVDVLDRLDGLIAAVRAYRATTGEAGQ